MKRLQKLTLDINKEDSFNIVNYKQGDTGELVITLYEDNKAKDVANQTIYLYVKKADNTFVEQTTNISALANVVTINLDEQVLTAEGRAYAELMFTDEHGKMTSSGFMINVGDRKVNIEDLIESDSSMAILDEIRQFIEQAKLDIQEYQRLVTEYSGKLEELDTKAQEVIKKLDVVGTTFDELNKLNEKSLEIIQSLKDQTNQSKQVEGTVKALINQANRVKELLETTLTEQASPTLEELKLKIEEAKGLKTDLEGIKAQVEELLGGLNSAIENANNTKGALEGLDATAKQTHQELHALVEEAKQLIIQVQDFIERNSVSEDVNQLKADMQQAKSDIEQLKTNLDKKVSKDIVGNIGTSDEGEGLASFNEAIQTGHYRILSVANDAPNGTYEKDDIVIVYNSENEGKGSIYQKIVGYKQYERIGKHTVNLLTTERTIIWRPWKEINLEGGSSSNVDLSNYYDKGHTDNLLSKKLDKEPIGVIGNSPLPEVFNGVSAVIDTEFARNAKGVLAYNSNKANVAEGSYCLVLFSCMPGVDCKKVLTYKYEDGTFGYLSSSLDSAKMKCYRKDSNGEWRTEGVALTSSHYFKNMEVYALNFDIYDRDSQEDVLVYGEEIPKLLSDYDSAIEQGTYIVSGVATSAPIDGLSTGVLKVTVGDGYIFQEYNGEEDYKRRFIEGEWQPWEQVRVKIPNSYTKKEADANLHKGLINIESVHDTIPNHGLVSSVEASYNNPLWDKIPVETYNEVPSNPNPTEYKWFMKCTHYNHHMVFYFKEDPTTKIAVFDNEGGKKQFKWLDKSFTYDTYAGWYRQASSASGKWTAFQNDNHFESTTRELKAMYGHNFNLMNANDLSQIYYRGLPENPDEVQDSVTSFDTAINKKFYKVKQEEGENLPGAPREGRLYGMLEVQKVDGYYKQIFTNQINEKFERIFSPSGWSKWSKNTQEEIMTEALYSVLDDTNKDILFKNDDSPETLLPESSINVINNGNLIVEHGEYIVDVDNNTSLEIDKTREFTDIIPLSAKFTKVLGCTITIDRLDTHYNFYINGNIVPIIEEGMPNCARLYLAYFAPDSIKKEDVWNKLTGVRKINYTIIGF